MKSNMNYLLIVEKEDCGVWKDFFRINADRMVVTDKRIVNDAVVHIRFRPVFGQWRKLHRAFQMEANMGTIFTLEVDL